MLPQDITDETPDFLSQEKKGTKAHLELFIHWGIFLIFWGEGEREGSFSVLWSFLYFAFPLTLFRSLYSFPFFSFQVKRARKMKMNPPKTSHTNTGEAFLIFLLKAGELAYFSLFMRGRGILVFTSIKKLGLHVIIVKKFGIERTLHRPTSCPSLVCSSSARR